MSTPTPRRRCLSLAACHMNIGDTIVYADGTRDRIVGFLDVNGQPGVMVKPLRRKAMMMSDTFKLRAEVERWVGAGIWKIQPAKRKGREKP